MQTTNALPSQTRVLLGPSSIREIDEIPWPTATVAYLKRERPESPQTCSRQIYYYDRASMRGAVRGVHMERDLAELVMTLNGDPNCFFLAERERADFFNGAFLTAVEICNHARYAWRVLKEYRPRLIIFHNTPHELFTYILWRVALYLNIETMMVHFSALPWRMCVSRFMADGSMTKLKMRDAWSGAEGEAVSKYMQRLQSHHEAAIPFADMKLIAPQSNAISIEEEIRAILRGSVVKNLVRIVRKLTLYQHFKKHVKSDTRDIKKPYVAFLLHYQPEEATIPRGGIFGQQLNALIRLRSMLPSEVSIAVKENKATFRGQLALGMGVRSGEFYTAICSLPNTYFVPLEHDTFDLVDNAVGVATVTGSVGIEALCRGKRVVIFGDANYRNFAGVTRLDMAASAPDLSWVMTGATHETSLTQRDLLNELLFSVGPANEENQRNLQSQRSAAIEAFHFVSRNIDRLIADQQSVCA